MSWATQAAKQTLSGDGYAILSVFTLQAGSLYSLQTADAANSVSIDIMQDVQLQFASAENNASNVISVVTDNSVTIETPQRSKFIDGLDGTEKAASAAAAVESIVITMLDTSAETLAKIQTMKGSTKVIVCRVGLGKTPTGASRGYASIMGKITGGFTRQTSGNTPSTLQLTISGGITYNSSALSYTDYNTLLPANVTPIGEDTPLTLADITSGNWTTLLGGEILVV